MGGFELRFTAGQVHRLLLVCCIGAPALAAAQSAGEIRAYPTKPVRTIVPYPAGGGTDIVGRIIGQRLAEIWSRPVVVDNRPGASATVGTGIAARARPDGYTLETVADAHAINVSLFRRLPYDPLKDFSPVVLLVTAPNVLIVHPSVAATSLNDLIALAKSKPGQLNFSSGSGGTSFVLSEMLNAAAGINIVHVPYKGASPAMTGLLGAEVQMTIAPTPTALAQLRANRVRALAVLSAQRSPLVPGAPTIAESGFPGFVYDTWYGVVAPARTPPAIIAKVNADIVRLLELPEVKTLFEQQGTQPAGGSPAEFRAFILAETEKWAKAIKAAGVRPVDF